MLERSELSEFEVEVVTTDAEDKAGKPKKLNFKRAAADSWESYKEIGKAIDGNAESAWTIPTNAVNEPHAALFVLGEPMKVKANSELHVRLRYEASKSKRVIGRFRLAAAQTDELAHFLIPPKQACSSRVS